MLKLVRELCWKLAQEFSFFSYIYSVLWVCLKSQIVSIGAQIVLSKDGRDVCKWFSKRNLHFWVFAIFLLEKNRENHKMTIAKHAQKICVFSAIVQKSREIKEQCFLGQKLPDTICVRKGEAKTAFLVHTICFGQTFFGPKQSESGKTTKIVVSAEIA